VLFVTEHQIEQIYSVFRKARKWQITTDEYDIVAIAERLRKYLFQQSLHSKPKHQYHESPATGTQRLNSNNKICS